MSGWDASSRPSWDPQDGDGENTQAFSAPDSPEAASDPWPGPAPQQGSSYRGRHQGDGSQSGGPQSHHRSDGFGLDAGSAGAPPDIFRQDYDQQDYGQQDYGQQDYGQQDYGQQDFGQQDFGQRDFPQRDPGQRERAGTGYSREVYGQGAGSNGLPRLDPQDYSSQARQDDARYGTQRDYTPRDYVGRDRPGWDLPADQDQFADRDRSASRDDAARMDPALADFFAPQPPRLGGALPGAGQPGAGQPGAGQPGAGQQRNGGRGYPGQGAGQGIGPGAQSVGQGAGQRPTRPTHPSGIGLSGAGRNGAGHARRPAQQSLAGQPGAGPARPGQHAQSGQPGPTVTGPLRRAQHDLWDGPAAHPVTRSGRRQGRRPRRSVVTVGVAVGLVAAVGIAIGAVMLTRKPAPTSASGTQATPATAPSQPTASAGTKSASTTTQPAAKPAGYTLTTPATAGSYPRLTPVPAAVTDAAASTADAVRGAAVTDGGKVTSTVTAAYQLSGGQVLAFTGYTGKFDPAKVMASLASLGTNANVYDAGSHGGKLACATAPGTQRGTVCVWVTTTTLGVTEFFGSVGPEVVTHQSKAAADAVRLRDGVEVKA